MQAVEGNGRVSIDRYIQGLGERMALTSDGDLAAVVMAEEIRVQDGRIAQALRDVQLTSAARDVISKRVAVLRQALAQLRTENKGKDEVTKPVPSLTRDDLTPLDISVNTVTSRIEVADDGALLDGVVPLPKGPDGKEGFEVSGSVLDAEIRRLEGLQQGLDTEREVRMIDLNNLMNKRSNMIQWLSNVSKKHSETQAGIINNLR
ncbi:MAG: hypothetical protein IPL40_09405 [Proteobacteria bacterium]|nr:hypothetical protein [Pseudomonadota bacterium]